MAPALNLSRGADVGVEGTELLQPDPFAVVPVRRQAEADHLNGPATRGAAAVGHTGSCRRSGPSEVLIGLFGALGGGGMQPSSRAAARPRPQLPSPLANIGK